MAPVRAVAIGAAIFRVQYEQEPNSRKLARAISNRTEAKARAKMAQYGSHGSMPTGAT